jgi:hypothetical protein
MLVCQECVAFVLITTCHRLNHLMGYGKEDLRGKLAFDFHHHDDTEATLECSRGGQ